MRRNRVVGASFSTSARPHHPAYHPPEPRWSAIESARGLIGCGGRAECRPYHGSKRDIPPDSMLSFSTHHDMISPTQDCPIDEKGTNAREQTYARIHTDTNLCKMQ